MDIKYDKRGNIKQTKNCFLLQIDIDIDIEFSNHILSIQFQLSLYQELTILAFSKQYNTNTIPYHTNTNAIVNYLTLNY